MARKLYGVFSDKFGLTYSKKTASDYVKKHGGEVRFINDAPEYHSFDAHTFHAISKPLAGAAKKNPAMKLIKKEYNAGFESGVRYTGTALDKENVRKANSAIAQTDSPNVYSYWRGYISGVVARKTQKHKSNPKKKKPVKPFDGNFGTGYIGNPAKLSHQDKMAHEYGGMLSTGEYIDPRSTPSWERLRKRNKEDKMFKKAKREIVRLKGKEKKNPVNINAIIGAIKSPKTPKHLKEGLKRKYGHLLK